MIKFLDWGDSAVHNLNYQLWALTDYHLWGSRALLLPFVNLRYQWGIKIYCSSGGTDKGAFSTLRSVSLEHLVKTHSLPYSNTS